jgi:hypothetical protein
MIIKQIRDEDFTNYKKPSMVIGFPTCDWKCEKECGIKGLCQNSSLASAPNIKMSPNDIIIRYMNNPITKAVVLAGLEPFDSWNELQCFVLNFRYWSSDDIVIYTGYNKNEIDQEKLKWLALYEPVIIKYGRFIPNQEPHYDEVLGIKLASNNQYAEELKYNEM